MIKPFQELMSAIQLSRKPGIGAASYKGLINQYQTPTKALNSWEKENKDKTIRTRKKKEIIFEPDTLEAYLNNTKDSYIYLGSPDYPKKLSETPEPPPFLFLRGQTNQITQLGKSIAIVGMRTPNQKCSQLSYDIAKLAASRGYSVISGLAKGVDRAAHYGALENNGKTIGVLATGVDIIYPKENTELYSKMAPSGLICSEFLPGTHPHTSFFPTRNRIIAGLADMTVILDGKANSGALYTAKNTLKFNRQLLTRFEESYAEPEKQGPKKAIKWGAKTFKSLDDLEKILQS